ncbi:MAG: hypothetical protein VYA34_04560 [Myxococcota bacterium]|nr:hypothetical protein [Myxococcota bacterium]
MVQDIRTMVRALLLGCIWLLPGLAWGYVADEGVAMGDLGEDFGTPQQLLRYPHQLRSSNQSIYVQWTKGMNGQSFHPYKTISLNDLLNPATQNPSSLQSGSLLLHSENEAMANGLGLVFSPMDNVYVGLWFSDYAPAWGGFVDRGLIGVGWINYVGGGGATDFSKIDQYRTAEAGYRQFDSSLAYRWSEMDLDLGFRVYGGGSSRSQSPDDSTGPVVVLSGSQSNPTTSNQFTVFDVATSRYGASDFGFVLGAGFDGVPGLSLDFSVGAEFIGFEYNVNNIGELVDAGGQGLEFSLRAHYEVNRRFSVGSSLTFEKLGLSFEPLRQRDGGILPVYDFGAIDGSSLDDPNSGNNTLAGSSGPSGAISGDVNEIRPVKGTVYQEDLSKLNWSILVGFNPNSRLELLAGVGMSLVNGQVVSGVGGKWEASSSGGLTAFPHVRIGLNGAITDWLDLMIGLRHGVYSWQLKNRAFDDRIPKDDQYQTASGGVVDDNTSSGASAAGGTQGVTPPAENMNKNRQEKITESTETFTNTDLTLGLKFKFGDFSIMTHLNTDTLFKGLYFLFGESANGNASGSETAKAPLVWVGMRYYWGGDDHEDEEEVALPVLPKRAVPNPALTPKKKELELNIEVVPQKKKRFPVFPRKSTKPKKRLFPSLDDEESITDDLNLSDD